VIVVDYKELEERLLASAVAYEKTHEHGTKRISAMGRTTLQDLPIYVPTLNGWKRIPED